MVADESVLVGETKAVAVVDYQLTPIANFVAEVPIAVVQYDDYVSVFAITNTD